MIFTKKQKFLIGLGAFIFILIITNPSVSAFKAYKGSNTYLGLKRPLNFFVCSVYNYRNEKYFGVVGNFIPILERVVVIKGSSLDSERIADSALMVDSSKVVLSEKSNVKMTVDQFALKIKIKYPQYQNIDNRVLVTKILEKYPVYKDDVIFN